MTINDKLSENQKNDFFTHMDRSCIYGAHILYQWYYMVQYTVSVSVWCYASTMVSSTIMWYNAMSHTMVKIKLILSTQYCFSFYDKSIMYCYYYFVTDTMTHTMEHLKSNLFYFR